MSTANTTAPFVRRRVRPDGLRSEQIREELGLDKREVPRVLQEGLAKKKLKSRVRKRATTYTAV